MADKWTGASPFNPKTDKPIELPGGGKATEYTATIEVDGKFVNVPQIWFQNGKPIFFDAKAGRRLDIMVNRYEAATGKMFPRFNTEAEATKAARKRSTSGGAMSQTPGNNAGRGRTGGKMTPKLAKGGIVKKPTKS